MRIKFVHFNYRSITYGVPEGDLGKSRDNEVRIPDSDTTVKLSDIRKNDETKGYVTWAHTVKEIPATPTAVVIMDHTAIKPVG